MLPCCHSFCTQCIQSLITEGTGTNSITCPSCHQTTPVPTGGIINLPNNFGLNNKKSDIFRKIYSNPSPPCDSCTKNSGIVFCTDCRDLLCKQCWEAHQLVRSIRTHSYFTLDEARSMTRDTLAKSIPSFAHTCQDHTDQQLDFYCQECIIPVCIKCTVINHKDHPVIDIQNQVNSNKATLCESLKGFQEAQQQLKKVLISGEEIKEKINAGKIEIDTIIHQTFATLQQLLHERKEALLAQSSEVANAKEVHLCRQLDGIKHLFENMTYCESLVTSTVGEYNDVELLSVANTLQTRANQLQKEFSETSLEVCESPTISLDIYTDELVKKIENVGVVFGEISPNNTTEVMPFGAAVGKEYKVQVILKDCTGKQLSKRGAMVKGMIAAIEENNTNIPAITTDCGDGTYFVSLIPQQLGRHKFFLTIKDQPIQGSPFIVPVATSRDYTALINPVRSISGINCPWFIAFSNNGNMFTTSCGNHCIYVYDSNGRQKTTVGSFGTGPLQFNYPSGIAINGGIIYVAEQEGDRIHKLNLKGEFLGTFGSKGSGKGQFSHIWSICIGPNGRLYVADSGNNRLQVFHHDKSLSHIIKGNEWFKSPTGLSFDPSGYLHVTCYKSNIVNVFTGDGEHIRQYGQSHLNGPRGIAIDSAGNSLVVNNSGDSLAIFDSYGVFIHLIQGFYSPIGVAVASNGSVWVADQRNNRLVKY